MAQRRVSTSTKWTEEDRARIHILGLNSHGILYGHSLGQLRARPPLTYIVPSNQRVLQLAMLNGEIEVIEGDDHYITGGFDVEACDRLPSSSLYEYPSTNHVRINTLTLPAKTKFDIKTEPQPNDSYAPYKGLDRSHGASVKFNNDPSELGYGSGQRLVVESTPAERKINTADLVLMDNEKAKETLGPIKNLICAVDVQSVVHALQANKHRLSRESTILLTEKGMGIMEMVNEQVFPNPKTRPTYIPGVFSHAVWQSGEVNTNSDVLSEEREARFSDVEERVNQNSLAAKRRPFGSLLLGPVAAVEGETVKQRKTRQKCANYLLSALLDPAASLGAICVSADKLLFTRLRDLAIASVVGPTTVRYNCNNRGIGADEERIAHVESRLREAARIVQAYFPTLTYEYLAQGLGNYLVMSGDRVNMMFKNVVSGRKSNIEVCFLGFCSGSELVCGPLGSKVVPSLNVIGFLCAAQVQVYIEANILLSGTMAGLSSRGEF
jgi:ketopantoate reductase